MTIVKSTENNFCIILNPTELNLIESDIPVYKALMVHDVASYIKFILTSELKSVQGRTP